jgi:hypothetical protein
MQYIITPAAGKRLIGKAVADKLSKYDAAITGTIVIIAGTTNAYIAEELLEKLNQSEGFDKKRFFRGISVPPKIKTTITGRLTDESKFIGDVVIQKGKWLKGKTIFDILDELDEGDIIVKGANCVNVKDNKAGVIIGHPKGGTVLAALQVVTGKRVKLIIPVGLEKRTNEDIDYISQILNKQGSKGYRLMPVTGEIITEIEAIKYLWGLDAKIFAAGGVCGAEGGIWLNIEGDDTNFKEYYSIIANEESFFND